MRLLLTLLVLYLISSHVRAQNGPAALNTVFDANLFPAPVTSVVPVGTDMSDGVTTYVIDLQIATEFAPATLIESSGGFEEIQGIVTEQASTFEPFTERCGFAGVPAANINAECTFIVGGSETSTGLPLEAVATFGGTGAVVTSSDSPLAIFSPSSSSLASSPSATQVSQSSHINPLVLALAITLPVVVVLLLVALALVIRGRRLARHVDRPNVIQPFPIPFDVRSQASTTMGSYTNDQSKGSLASTPSSSTFRDTTHHRPPPTPRPRLTVTIPSSDRPARRSRATRGISMQSHITVGTLYTPVESSNQALRDQIRQMRQEINQLTAARYGSG